MQEYVGVWDIVDERVCAGSISTLIHAIVHGESKGGKLKDAIKRRGGHNLS